VMHVIEAERPKSTVCSCGSIFAVNGAAEDRCSYDGKIDKKRRNLDFPGYILF
jgi:hypothetical protein